MAKYPKVPLSERFLEWQTISLSILMHGAKDFWRDRVIVFMSLLCLYIVFYYHVFDKTWHFVSVEKNYEDFVK